jgi:transcriptional regulator with XRE-family HTH domain
VAKQHGLQRSQQKANIIAKRLRFARGMHTPPLSQEELSEAIANIIGVEVQTNAISKIEGNQRSVYDFEVVAFSKVLGVTTDWLLGVSDEGGFLLPKHPFG